MAVRPRDGGFSTAVGLLSMAAGLVVVALLLVVSTTVFGGSSSSPGNANRPSLLSRSSAETQIELCAEGRPSTYGNPPAPAVRALCVRKILGQAGGAGAPVP